MDCKTWIKVTVWIEEQLFMSIWLTLVFACCEKYRQCFFYFCVFTKINYCKFLQIRYLQQYTPRKYLLFFYPEKHPQNFSLISWPFNVDSFFHVTQSFILMYGSLRYHRNHNIKLTGKNHKDSTFKVKACEQRVLASVIANHLLVAFMFFFNCYICLVS